MANTSITIRIEEELKNKLQALTENLGMDMTTFFIMAAKQAIREQALPFLPRMNALYDSKAYELARNNTRYNANGKATISADDEWINETEWEDVFQQMKNNTTNNT